jgi:hypothetical protein
VTTHKTPFFIVTAVKNSNLTIKRIYGILVEWPGMKRGHLTDLHFNGKATIK